MGSEMCIRDSMFHLKRFEFVGGLAGGGRKLQDHVPFPQVLLVNGERFEFAAVVTHEGPSASAGHYTACVDSGRLYVCDDSHVRRTDWAHVAAQQAYLLMYVRTAASGGATQ